MRKIGNGIGVVVTVQNIMIKLQKSVQILGAIPSMLEMWKRGETSKDLHGGHTDRTQHAKAENHLTTRIPGNPRWRGRMAAKRAGKGRRRMIKTESIPANYANVEEN